MAQLLFFANKWISMVFAIMGFIACTLIAILSTAIGIVQFIPGAVFSALRIYVLSRSKLLAIFVLLLSLAPVGANLAYYGYRLRGEYSCKSDTVVIISRVPLVVADSLLIFTTWAALRSRDRKGLVAAALQPGWYPITHVLLRDGSIYFIVLLVLNLLHLVLSATSLVSNNTDGSLMTIFTAPITAILISHFLLDLQEANRTDVRMDAGNPLQFSGDPYNSSPSFISSLGAFTNPNRSGRSSGSEDNDDEDLSYEVDSRSDGEDGEGSGVQASHTCVPNVSDSKSTA
ncbi:hypothetical protein L226DRAFT_614396 [Lentinus tigrinus ALCF2SS1-7]|uniref:Uncharacterized protein n=1 Tax=Lentinus tigrinus ALCF2SS1-6 TaxID=1328759 RepID=A0A5C2S1E2_9APHY|nr:hypothetical protein L227DRAFT_655613 [Lentinus tigrinus ALCF2SS1-6]RPD73159.1 hypothetical protein L226DRAFT_614396 [Lentinus tigrinus ALCF2SS1-7]